MCFSTLAASGLKGDSRVLKGDSHQIWRTQRARVNVASLRLFLRSSTGPNRAIEPQSLGRVRDPVRILRILLLKGDSPLSPLLLAER